MVPSELIGAWRRAGSPTSNCPSLVKATNDGKALPEETPAPSADGMMTGRPPSMTAAAEFDVPRSIPMTRAISVPSIKIRNSKHEYSKQCSNFQITEFSKRFGHLNIRSFGFVSNIRIFGFRIYILRYL